MTLKVYKKLLTVELKDGTKLYSEKTIEQLEKYMSNAGNFLNIDGCLFNKFEFKKAYYQNVDGISDYILSLDEDIRKLVQKREEDKKFKIGRGFDSLEEVQKYVKKIL